jgi:hypothetical protein
MSVTASLSTTVAKLTVLDGLSAGKEISLLKALTTIGLPGTQTAAIARRANGYYLMYIEGNAPPCINGNAIGREAHEIVHGDMINVSGTRMRFSSH